MTDFNEVWAELFPAEQQRIANLLIDRVVIFQDRVEVHLRIAGFTKLIAEMNGAPLEQRAA